MDKKIEHPFNYMCQAPPCPPISMLMKRRLSLSWVFDFFCTLAGGVRFLLYSHWVCQKLLQHWNWGVRGVINIRRCSIFLSIDGPIGIGDLRIKCSSTQYYIIIYICIHPFEDRFAVNIEKIWGVGGETSYWWPICAMVVFHDEPGSWKNAFSSSACVRRTYISCTCTLAEAKCFHSSIS